MISAALTIAGSDPSGGAGIQADLKTFHEHAVYGMSVITLLTVQNTQRVQAVEIVNPKLVLAQLDAVLSDIIPAAGKTGALGSRGIIEALAERAQDFSFPLVIDPVMTSKHGASLLEPGACNALKEKLLGHAFLVTPNLDEATLLSGEKVQDVASMERACIKITRYGSKNVLIKGGHLSGEATDVLWTDGKAHHFSSTRVLTKNTHGTGCVFSAAITALLARGEGLVEAVRGAKAFITRALETSPGLGKGTGPVNMFSRYPSKMRGM